MTVDVRILAPAFCAVLLAGCGQDSGNPPGVITVQAGDDSCTLSAGSVPAGTVRFDITNVGNQVTEFYLYGDGDGDRVVSEVEDIGPGMTRQLVVEVPQAGKYTTACKPGMQGGGIRGELTVTEQVSR